jgi:PKD repeat protein/N-acetylneuraminic acid mutarotase
MKALFLLQLIFAIIIIEMHAQEKWTQKADYGGIERREVVGFAINGKGYIVTGEKYEGWYICEKDFWEYDPENDVWTQKADFAGVGRYAAIGFAIGDKGYVGWGLTSPFSYVNDFWEYDVNTNSWTQKADLGPNANREGGVGFSIGEKGYIGSGVNHDLGYGYTLNDFWEYDPQSDTWTQMADFAGESRAGAVGFCIGEMGYIGTENRDGYQVLYNDFWEYDPALDLWTQKADFGGNPRTNAASFVIGKTGYVGTGIISSNENSSDDFWAYDQNTNTWKQLEDFEGMERCFAVGFSIGVKGYFGTGWFNDNNHFKDFWEFDPLIGLINDFSSSATAVCINESIVFTPNDLVIEPDSIIWTFQGGIPEVSFELEPAVEYTEIGFYDVTLTSYYLGESATVHKADYISVYLHPEVPARPQGETLVCFNQHSSTYTTNLDNVIWHLEPAMAGSISYSDSICIIYWNETFYDEAQLRVQSFNNCGISDFSEPLSILRTERPDTDFTATPLFIPEAPYEVQFTNLSPNPEQYNFTWHFGNGDTSQETEPKYTYSESGMYSVLLVAHHIETGCSDTLTKADYVQCSAEGISDYRQDGFRYFVNQTSKTLQLIFDEQPDGYAFNLLGIDGKYFKTILLTEKVSHLSLNNLSPGVYVFMIKADDKQFNGKIIF